jgi:hypothetical protein
MAWRILSGPLSKELHRLCQHKKPVLQGFPAMMTNQVEKLAGSKEKRTAISTAP